MAVRININEARLLEYHQQQMDEIYLLYHTYPTLIPKWHNPDPAEVAQLLQDDATGRELARGLVGGRSAGHKCTVFHRDPDYCNGLPRRKGR